MARNFKSTTGRTFALVDSGLNSPRDLAFDGERGASPGKVLWTGGYSVDIVYYDTV